jgi:hypothetical protein
VGVSKRGGISRVLGLTGGGGPFGGHDPQPSEYVPKEPRSRRWKVTFLVIALAVGFALVMGGNALAHVMSHATGIGSCGGG